ncbi:MAG: TIGR03915 family putative DNA repair protein [Coriobacteriaceae bacterium]|nr:TIGR03915 family putative DNA repair protein [Coriobacteriaceae bacterium]
MTAGAGTGRIAGQARNDGVGGLGELAFVFDGSLEGLLSAVFVAYAEKLDPCDIVRPENLQPRLGQAVREVATDIERALRVQKGICKNCGPSVFEAVKAASLSDDPDIGTVVYRFLRYALEKNSPRDCAACRNRARCGGLCTREHARSVLSDLVHPSVEPFVAAHRAVYNERHRIMQFLRFEQVEGGVWFAQCNPKASVVPLVMDWFASRFNTQAFMVYDEAHRLAGVYEGREWYLVKTDLVAVPERTPDELVMQQAWKRFYQTIAVESRYNPELRRQFMPKRLWKNIVEMQEDLPASTAIRRSR